MTVLTTEQFEEFIEEFPEMEEFYDLETDCRYDEMRVYWN